MYFVGEVFAVQKTINRMLVIISIVSMILLMWPFAMWNDVMLLILRIIPTFAIQILLCRVGKYTIIKMIPLLLTGGLAVWGSYLFYTSPHWINATFWGSLIADYVSPFICCVVTIIIWRFSKKR